MLIQDLWLARYDWDDEIEKQHLYSWQGLEIDLKLVNGVKVPRFLSTLENAKVHMFSDASERAYGAAVYIVNRAENRAGLLVSKSKVAPIQTMTVPRLELCAAHLGARLLENVMKLMPKVTQCYAWTDSMIVLAWLKQLPRKWKTFVANRTADIHAKTPTARWMHVPSEHNPADLISRGCTAIELQRSKIWWSGPTWICSKTDWPRCNTVVETNLEVKPIQLKCMMSSGFSSVLEMLLRIKTHTRRIRAIATLRRLGSDKAKTGEITAEEYWAAEQRLWFLIQQENLDVEHAKKLAPFKETTGLWRVGGRLEHAAHMPWEHKHPIILPKGNKLVEDFILEKHYDNQHAGVTVMLGVLQGYWFLGRGDTIRKGISRCKTCARYRKVSYEPRMGDLPEERVNEAMAFERTGVDFAGPFSILLRRSRGKPIITKGYLCLFVCMCTRAVHLEVATDMSVAGFLSCFRRFSSRRGYPQLMVSDNGTNFVGANRRLSEMHLKLLKDQDELMRALTPLQIRWKFICPTAPFMGGLWESAVREAKRQILRTVGTTCMTYEEWSTLFADIEACLNTRPLCVAQDEVVTPSHLVCGQNLRSAPLHLASQGESSVSSIWRHLQKILQDFWSSWKNVYLQDMQIRQKWYTEKGREVAVGDWVVVKDEATHPSNWPLFKIVELHKGNDGRARIATLENLRSQLQRPVRKLVKIPIDPVSSRAAGCCSEKGSSSELINDKTIRKKSPSNGRNTAQLKNNNDDDDTHVSEAPQQLGAEVSSENDCIS